MTHIGNDKKYSLDHVKELDHSPLKDKSILFLGSSVTLGACSENESFADFIAKRNKCKYLKEAVNGTTLVTSSPNSYIKRLLKIDKSLHFDLFICQLSTNDATQNKPLGDISNKDTTTICGAINYIIQYVKETFHCPIVFYTNPYYENINYLNMVKVLNNIKEINVINLFEDQEFNSISKEERNLYMADDIHPTKAGYLLWWTPYIEKYLNKLAK